MGREREHNILLDKYKDEIATKAIQAVDALVAYNQRPSDFTLEEYRTKMRTLSILVGEYRFLQSDMDNHETWDEHYYSVLESRRNDKPTVWVRRGTRT